MGRVLVTGAGGFIGRPLVRALAARHEVWAATRRPAAGAWAGLKSVRELVADLTAPDATANWPAAVDGVVHLAQSRFFRNNSDHADDIRAVNVEGTRRVLEWAREAGAGRFVLASSGGIYGASRKPLTEDMAFNASGALGYYLETKFTAEKLLRGHGGGMVAVVLRPFFVYGPGQSDDRLVPRLIGRIRRGEPVFLRPPDGLRINPLHVDDAVAAIARGLDLGEGATVNIAGPETLSLRDMAAVIGDALGVEPVFEAAEDAAAGDMVADTTLMNEILLAPEIGFREGVAPVCRAVAAT